MSDWPWEAVICKSYYDAPIEIDYSLFGVKRCCADLDDSYALAADIQTIPGLPTAPGYLNVDVDTETGEIDGLF